MADRSSERSAYATLGLQKGASEQDIKTAYVELVKKYDPEMHTDRFMVIQSAYNKLRDVKTRAKEDIQTYNVIRGEFNFLPEERVQDAPSETQVSNARDTFRKSNGDEATRRGFISLLSKRSFVAVSRKLWVEAIHDWAEIQQIDPTHVRARNNLLYAYISLGQSYALHGLHEEALDLWEKALQMNPDNHLVIHNLALVCEKCGEKEKAQKYWSETVRRWKSQLERDADNEYLKTCIIEALRAKGDHIDSSQSQSSPISRASGTAVPRPMASSTATPRPTFSREIENYREVLKLNPDDFEARFQMAQRLMEENKWEEASEELTKLNRQHPRNIEVYNSLGWCLLNAGQIDNAFATWNRSMAIDPKNSTTREMVVRAHLQIGKQFRTKGLFTNALVHFKKLQRYLPDSPEVRLEIAATYDMKGDVREAISEYNAVIQLDPKNKLARKALNDLRMKQR